MRTVLEELDRESQNSIQEVKERRSSDDSETGAGSKYAHCVR